MRLLRSLLVALLLTVGATPALAAEPREIDWLELMPAEDVAAMEKMLEQEINHSSNAPPPTYGSKRTVLAMDGAEGRIGGYIVPIETNSKNEITEFFFVPYYGACIHVPPPPPNQIIYVKPDTPVAKVDIWEPYWIEGTLHVQNQKNSIAASAYEFKTNKVTPYM